MASRLTQIKSLCLSLFVSLGEAHARVEALEQRVQSVRDAAPATPAAEAEQASAAESSSAAGDAAAAARAEEHVRAICAEVHRLCLRLR